MRRACLYCSKFYKKSLQLYGCRLFLYVLGRIVKKGDVPVVCRGTETHKLYDQLRSGVNLRSG